jgi:hypothetical protein
MARKTKADLAAEREAAEAARLLAAAEAYPQRLMNLLERATKENFELTVKEGQFRVEDRDDRRADAYLLTLNFTEESDGTLNTLEWYVMDKEEARAEAERRANLRTSALNKLSSEEREVLGL